MKEKIGFGIIGAGMSSELHADAMRQLDTVELVGFYDSFFPAAEKRAAEFGCRAYRSLDEFLGDPRIRAVSV